MAQGKRKNSGEMLHFKTNQEWQNWLQKYHDTASDLWLIFYRTNTDLPNIDLEEALSTARHFNWKHTLIKRIDDESYARKFIPIPPAQIAKKEDQTESEIEDRKYQKAAENPNGELPRIDNVFISPEIPTTQTELDETEPFVIDIPEEQETTAIPEEEFIPEDTEDEQNSAPENENIFTSPSFEEPQELDEKDAASEDDISFENDLTEEPEEAAEPVEDVFADEREEDGVEEIETDLEFDDLDQKKEEEPPIFQRKISRKK
ncbi:MAG TPA: hypothetical protein PLD62_01750 [Candidatus Cloacimonadota bacterium]|nr:hypothetical protein [Candidatus Cloacimonadota bacterium]